VNFNRDGRHVGHERIHRSRGERRGRWRRLLGDVKDVGRQEDVGIRAELAKVVVLGIVPDDVGVETEPVGEPGEGVALADDVGLHGSRGLPACERPLDATILLTEIKA